MKKIIIIVLSTLIFLGLVGFIVIKYTYHTINYFSKTVESSFNLSLKNVKNKAEDFKLKYSDFKCSGKRSIECSAEKILLDKERYKIEVKDINFILTPYYKSADFSFNAGASYKIFVDESFKSLPIKLECFGKLDLMPEKTYIKADYWCNTYVNYLKSYHTSRVYFKNKEFNEPNIYEFAKKFDSYVLNKEYIKKVSKTSFAIEYLRGYIKSKDLFQEYVNIIRRFDVNYELDRESAEISVSNFNAELFFTSSIFGKNSFEYSIFKKITENIQNIVLKHHNRLSYNITIKGGRKLDNLFISDFKQAVKIVYEGRNYHMDMETSPK